jgi:hypothetical protein
MIALIQKDIDENITKKALTEYGQCAFPCGEAFFCV